MLLPDSKSLHPIKGLSVKSIQDETPPPPPALGISAPMPVISTLAPYSPEIKLGTLLGSTKVLNLPAPTDVTLALNMILSITSLVLCIDIASPKSVIADRGC